MDSLHCGINRHVGAHMSLVPCGDKRLVEPLPLTFEPNWRRRKSFLAERVHGDDVITPGGFAGFVVTLREAGDRIRSQAHDRVLVIAPVHPVNTIAFDVLLWIRRPLEMTRRVLFFREYPLRGRWNREQSRRWTALRSPR